MDNSYENINSIGTIIENVINEINTGKSKIFKIADSLRDEFQKKNVELEIVKKEIEETIEKVDQLEILDKKMRVILSETSKMEGEKFGDLIEKRYEEAFEIRVEYITKQNEEKDLRRRRDSLEQTLKNYSSNIEVADNTVNQINIALGYLEGDVFSQVENKDKRNIFNFFKRLSKRDKVLCDQSMSHVNAVKELNKKLNELLSVPLTVHRSNNIIVKWMLDIYFYD